MRRDLIKATTGSRAAMFPMNHGFAANASASFIFFFFSFRAGPSASSFFFQKQIYYCNCLVRFSFNCALVRSSVALSKVLTATFSRFNTIDSTSRQLSIHGCCYFRLEKKMQESYGIAARNVRFLMGFFRTLFNRHCRF